MTDQPRPRRHDVAVIGYGPVGATVAGLLGARGLDVVVVDKDTDLFPLPRAAHLDHTSLRTLQELGVTDEVMADMLPNPGLDFVNAARQRLFRIPGNQGSVSGLPASMYFHQPGFERALRRAVSALPAVDVRLGTNVYGLRDLGDHVALRVTRPGGAGTIEASWVVACDGASSTTRGVLGTTFDDLRFTEQWLVVDLLLDRPVPALPDHAIHVCDPARPHSAIPMPGARYRFELMLLDSDDRATVATRESLDRLLAQWLEPGAARLERSAVYTFRGIVAEPAKWRTGRVFLAGDAAHQMPPFLGQGMCSGMRDAANLAWKLEAVVRGRVHERVLDTYGPERAPHVHGITRAAVDFGAIICCLDPAQAAERDRRYLDGSLGLDTASLFGLPKLQPGPLVLDGGGSLFPQIRVNGRRLDDVLGPRFLVLAQQAAMLADTRARWEREFGAVVATPGELDDEAGTLARWLGKARADAVVVRPDRYVLWAGRDLARTADHLDAVLAGRGT